MGAFQVFCILSGLVYSALAAPSAKAEEAEISGTVSGRIPPLLTFKDGNVGVNFLGFKASAGLGGLLTGDATQGGLHAEAETPFGQKAGAGLGGAVDANGRSAGGLYAGATAGGGVGASAGLDGRAGADGSAGRSYAGASAGGISKTVVKERIGGAPAAAGASFSGSLNIHKNVEISAPSTASKTVEIVKEQPAVQKTYVERTVIPNYVEKTIQVPSYVEKTVRVPTVIEKRVRVPAEPTVIEKEIAGPQPQPLVLQKQVEIHQEEVPIEPATVITKTRTKIHRRPWLHFRKHLHYESDTPYYGGVVAGGAYNSGYGYEGNYYGGNQGTYTTTVRKQFNPNFVNDVFNIPIATLGAVSNLVGGIAAGKSGSVAVSKSYSSY